MNEVIVQLQMDDLVKAYSEWNLKTFYAHLSINVNIPAPV